MTSKQLRRIRNRVDSYTKRKAYNGLWYLTLFCGNWIESIVINDENKQEVERLMEYVDRRSNNPKNKA